MNARSASRLLLFITALSFGFVPSNAHATGETSVYSETLPDFRSDRTLNFQRLQHAHDTKYFSVYGALLHERYVDQSYGSIEAGFSRVITPELRVLLAWRETNIGAPEVNDGQLRFGLIASKRWELVPNRIAFETYLEAFGLAPRKSSLQSAGSAWARVGYQAWAQNYWILEPLILEGRTYRSSNPVYSGEGFVALGLGPKASYWWPMAEGRSGSISLFVSRSYVWPGSRTGSFQNWFLLTGGASF